MRGGRWVARKIPPIQWDRLVSPWTCQMHLLKAYGHLYLNCHLEPIVEQTVFLVHHSSRTVGSQFRLPIASAFSCHQVYIKTYHNNVTGISAEPIDWRQAKYIGLIGLTNVKPAYAISAFKFIHFWIDELLKTGH